MTLFNQINSVRSEMAGEGWASKRKVETLAAIIVALRPAISVEIGVWFGKSAIPMALAHKHIGCGQLIAVDPWMASASVVGQATEADVEWWGRQSAHDQAFDSFNKRVFALGLQNVVKVERRNSADFEPPEGIGCLHLDGNHGAQAVDDVDRYCLKISMGGIVVMDDIGWSTGSVKLAVKRIKELGFRELYIVDDVENQWGVYQRV